MYCSLLFYTSYPSISNISLWSWFKSSRKMLGHGFGKLPFITFNLSACKWTIWSGVAPCSDLHPAGIEVKSCWREQMSGKAGPVARRRDAKLFRRDLAGWLICRSSCSLGTQLANGSNTKTKPQMLWASLWWVFWAVKIPVFIPTWETFWISRVIFLGLTLAHDQNCSGLSRLTRMIQYNGAAVLWLRCHQHRQPFLIVPYIRAGWFSGCFLPFFPLALLVLQH